jgi:hypothetical protein
MTRYLPRPPLRWLAALALLGATAAAAHAQYGYYPPAGYYPNGIYGRGYGYLTGQANIMQGQATVLDAYGNLGIQQAQATIGFEKGKQEELVTKRKTFDEMRYERDNTPSFTEKFEGTEALRIRRVLTSPLEAEITNGTAMNILLPFLTQLAQNSYHGGPPVVLNQEMLKLINVSSGTATAGAGLLKDGGKLRWPFVLRGPLQEKIDPLIQQGVALAAQDNLTPKLYNQIDRGLKDITEDLRKQFHREEIDGGGFLEGKRYLESLQNSVALLKSPNAPKIFGGAFAARGVTVDEVAMNMSSQGLKFAPAQPGNEAAYFSVYNSFKQYALASQGGSQASFRLRVAPTVDEYNAGKQQ